ncbi:MAG: efflux RND transporter periplasmic adaptor subunit [Candidatus Latescibacteria bacterium]|nr:efflux RND transporter periplasmic adaptor subunit [Candidatus Latescibacterota bacterium]
MSRGRLFLGVLLLASVRPVGGSWVAPLEAAHGVDVYVLAGGLVRQVGVQVGDRVAVGDTLLWLDDQVLQLQAQESVLELAAIQAQLSRAEQLLDQGGLAAQAVEALHLKYAQAHLRQQRVQIELATTVVCAVLDGLVADWSVEVGQLTSPRQMVGKLIVATDLKVDLYIPVDELTDLYPGQPVTGRASDQVLVGRIERISPVIDPASGRCRVRVLFPGSGQRVRPGTVVEIQWAPAHPLDPHDETRP